ncbi:hypothetical protein A7D21_29115 [Pseudomonas sp. AP19]|nr:hypothetical protein A7D21_29115 [Pseudomonas sp. AP19]
MFLADFGHPLRLLEQFGRAQQTELCRYQDPKTKPPNTPVKIKVNRQHCSLEPHLKTVNQIALKKYRFLTNKEQRIEPKKKQPSFILLKSRRPMFFGALAQVNPGLEPHEGDGFVIITAANDQGMVDTTTGALWCCHQSMPTSGLIPA